MSKEPLLEAAWYGIRSNALESEHSGPKPGAAVNARKQVFSTLLASVFPFVKWGGWTTWYVKSFLTLSLCNHYEGRSTQTPLTMLCPDHSQTEKTNYTWDRELMSGPTEDHTGLYFGLATEYSRNSACPCKQNSSFQKVCVCSLSYESLWITTLLSPPVSICFKSRLRHSSGRQIMTLWEMWQMETKWGFHLRYFQSSRNPIAPVNTPAS